MSRPKLFSNFFRVDRMAILAFFFRQLGTAVCRPIGSNRCVNLGRADQEWYVGLGGVEGGVEGGVGDGLEGRRIGRSNQRQRLDWYGQIDRKRRTKRTVVSSHLEKSW
jgi:hypothetical protein